MPTQSHRKKLFISYRVQDTSADTGRLVDSLKQVFYDDQIFMDIEKLEPGVDFTKALAKSLETCDVLFAVIGPEWVGEDKDGRPRIMRSDDWVRLELETALQRGIRLIPVLMRNATLPEMTDIPESLYPLLNRQTYEISNKRWKYDTDQLIQFLIQIGFEPRKQEMPVKPQGTDLSKWLIFGLFGLAVIVMGVLWFDAGDKKQADKIEIYDPGTRPGVDSNSVEHDDPPVSPQKPTAAPVVVEGAWYDAANFYTMYITQSANTLDLKSINAAGVTTGEGVGTVEGNAINFKMQIYNMGVFSGSATMANDNEVLNGKLIISNNNGATYTEPFYWTKQ